MRMIVRKKKKKHIILKLIMMIIISVICSFMLIRYFSKNIKPGLMIYAEDEVTRITTLIINNSIKNIIIEEIDEDNIFEIVRNNDGEIQLIGYNTKNVNILLNSIALIIQNNLKAIENGDTEFIDLSSNYLKEFDRDLLKQGIVGKVPIGSFLGSSLLTNVGPKIPIKFSLIGDVTTNIKTNIKEYGINNALLQVSIEVSVNFRVNLPFTSNKIIVSSEIPISMKIIQGSIPDFYTGGLQSNYGLVS